MTEEELKAYKREYNKKWRAAHPDYCREYQAEYRKKFREEYNEKCRVYQANHREAQRKRMNDYHKTVKGRATNLLHSYIQNDLERGFERPNLTRDDIVAKALTEGCECVYCHCNDLSQLGLDKITRSRPHDIDNVVCCCHRCNVKRGIKHIEDWIGKSLDDWVDEQGYTYSTGMVIQY